MRAKGAPNCSVPAFNLEAASSSIFQAMRGGVEDEFSNSLALRLFPIFQDTKHGDEGGALRMDHPPVGDKDN